MKNEKTNTMETCPCFDKQKGEKQGMMKCMNGARWFLLIPGVLVILAFLLGYILDSATVRELWLIITGSLIVLGTTFYILMNIWVNKLQGHSAQ